MDGSKHPTMHGRVALFKNFWARPADYGGCSTLFQQTSFPNSWYFLVCLYTVARQQSFLSNTPHSPNIFLLVLSNKCRVLECAYPRVLKCRILRGHKRPTWGSGSPFFNSCQWELKIQTLMGVCRAAQDLLRIITVNWEVDGEKNHRNFWEWEAFPGEEKAIKLFLKEHARNWTKSEVISIDCGLFPGLSHAKPMEDPLCMTSWPKQGDDHGPSMYCLVT